MVYKKKRNNISYYIVQYLILKYDCKIWDKFSDAPLYVGQFNYFIFFYFFPPDTLHCYYLK